MVMSGYTRRCFDGGDWNDTDKNGAKRKGPRFNLISAELASNE